MASLTEIKGFTTATMNKFRNNGIRSANSFLYECGSASKRRTWARKLGIQFGKLTEWIRFADLFRIKGIGTKYVELLHYAGVQDVRTLSKRSPQQLYKQMQAANDRRHVVRAIPSYKQVSRWVSQAKRMKKVVNY